MKKIRRIQAARTVRRWTAFLLCAVLMCSMVSKALPALAVDNEDKADNVDSKDVYCEHHPEHTADCGYVEAVEGQPCTHEHDEECSYVEGQPCTHEHDEECGYEEGQPCIHTHDEQCGYLEMTECTHEHDEDCGYVEAVEGQPCQFVCEVCGGGSEEESVEELEEESEQITAMSAAEPAALGDEQEEGLIAYFKFDEDSDRLHDYSGNSVGAGLHELVNQGEGGQVDWRVSSDTIADVSGYFEERNDESDESNSALHLDNETCLVLDANKLNDLKNRTEMTVEMQVKLDETNSGQNWLFYAAPNDSPAGENRRCLSLAFIGNSKELVAQRYNSGGGNAVSGREGRVAGSSGINDGAWHTVRVVYKVSSMALYVDGERVAEGSAPNKLADYFNDNSAIWFGHSGWTDNNNFNGYIDDIKIYSYANYDGLVIGPIDEEKYILTPTEPPNTTVNMFDYWITGQTDNDYNPPLQQDDLLKGGINANHLFLFAGSDGTSAGNFPNATSVVGAWNNYEYGGLDRNGYEHQKTQPFQGIVGDLLDGNGNTNGYPQLAIDELINSIDGVMPGPLDGRNTTESLAYLFDLSEPGGKAAYPKVSGLFRFGEEGDGDYEGYYYFRSNETFAELNTGQSDGAKTSIDGNHITLYKEPWMVGELGQFFPFNDGSDLFYVGDSDELVQAHSSLQDQSTTSEPMNHYFGMTVETQFTQPTDGLLHYYEETRPMMFDFSGDDDVWIFIDGVLVGDLGGLHNRVRITIDYATGEIVYRGALASNGIDGTVLTDFKTTLHDMFEKAGRDTSEWKEVGGNKLFPDGSKHTLKFFYLERGNNLSNCSIRFNLHDYPEEPPKEDEEPEDPTPTPPGDNDPDDPPTPPGDKDPDEPPTPPNPPKEDKPVNPPPEQPPEEDKPVDPPTEQPPEENEPTNPPTVQPPEQESEARTLGVLASPNTGDSNMVGLWLTLLVLSTAGIIVIHYRTRKR